MGKERSIGVVGRGTLGVVALGEGVVAVGGEHWGPVAWGALGGV